MSALDFFADFQLQNKITLHVSFCRKSILEPYENPISVHIA